MKRFVLYPGVGVVKPGDKPFYISAPLLATLCYRVPMRECINMDDPYIRKVASLGSDFSQLIPLLPNMSGIYKIPNKNEKKLILVEGLHEQVKKSG